MFQAIYGRRNSIFLPNFQDRLRFLQYVVGELHDAIRKGRHEQFADRLANVLSWTFCVTNSFPSIELAHALSRKFPDGYCPYCGEKPCTKCGVDRPPHRAGEVNPLQLTWTLQRWQQHFRELHADKNASSGMSNTERLSKEVTEILAIDMGIINSDASIEEVEEELGGEFADVVAWTIAVANEHDVDLEVAVLYLYEKGCPACHEQQCRCKRLAFQRAKLSDQAASGPTP